jgi:membrane protein DedA with SNARE-associated domain
VILNDRIDDIGYFLLFVYSFGGGFIGLATAAVLATLGKMSLVISILLAGTANFIGSTLLFYFARNSKTDAMNFLKKHRRKLALVHLLMRKHGSMVLFIQKFVYGIKTLVPLAAGITKYDSFKFISINLLASFFWALATGVLAYFSGSIIIKGLRSVEAYPWMAPIILASVVGAVYFYMTKATTKKN